MTLSRGNLRHQQVLLCLCRTRHIRTYLYTAGLRWALIRVRIVLRLFCLRRVGSRFLDRTPAYIPSHPFSILEQQTSVSCLQVRRIELSIVASPLIALGVEPSIGAVSGRGGLYDVPPSGSSQPTSTPSLQNRLAGAKRPPGCCGYHLHPVRASTRARLDLHTRML